MQQPFQYDVGWIVLHSQVGGYIYTVISHTVEEGGMAAPPAGEGERMGYIFQVYLLRLWIEYIDVLPCVSAYGAGVCVELILHGAQLSVISYQFKVCP